MVEHIRFNGPVFQAIRMSFNPMVAGATAVLLGLLAAAWCRWRLGERDPASWAWPMAIALACAPVIYPWYLLYFTPFLVTTATIPLIAWTISVVPVYYVWEVSRNGGRWVVPVEILLLEFAIVLVALAALGWRRWRQTASVQAFTAIEK